MVSFLYQYSAVDFSRSSSLVALVTRLSMECDLRCAPCNRSLIVYDNLSGTKRPNLFITGFEIQNHTGIHTITLPGKPIRPILLLLAFNDTTQLFGNTGSELDEH